VWPSSTPSPPSSSSAWPTAFPNTRGLFHLVGEVEVVFGFWAIVLVLVMALTVGGGSALAYAESRNYTEPLFVFVVMVIAASRPVLTSVMWLVGMVARVLPGPAPLARAWLQCRCWVHW
jgi:hypothetical protein